MVLLFVMRRSRSCVSEGVVIKAASLAGRDRLHTSRDSSVRNPPLLCRVRKILIIEDDRTLSQPLERVGQQCGTAGQGHTGKAARHAEGVPGLRADDARGKHIG